MATSSTGLLYLQAWLLSWSLGLLRAMTRALIMKYAIAVRFARAQLCTPGCLVEAAPCLLILQHLQRCSQLGRDHPLPPQTTATGGQDRPSAPRG